MVNYANGKIYKLVNNVDDEIYIGSTCRRLSDRKSGHKKDSRRESCKKYSVYQHLVPIGWDNVDIVLIENCKVQNKEQLHARERYYIESLKPSLNKVIPGRTHKEWCQDNTEHLKQYQKQWVEDNAKELKKYKNKWYEEHKEQTKARYKQYAIVNKERLKQHSSAKIECKYCDCKFRRAGKSRHIRSGKHVSNYKKAYLERTGQEFVGDVPNEL